jgi:hypothetical protein
MAGLREPNCQRLRETNGETSKPIAPSFLSSHHGELAHFSVTIKPGAQHRIIGRK